MTTQITIQTPKANRKELAEAFGQNQSAVRRIESMTQDITVNLPDGIDASSVLAQEALDLAQALQNVAYIIASANANVPDAFVLQEGTGMSITFGGGNVTIALTVPVTVANGGTGLQSLTANAVVIGNGTGAPNFAAPGTAGYVLMSNGAAADPSFQATVSQIIAGTGIDISGATGNVTVSLQTPVTVENGGTGETGASGAALDNITGFAGTGLIERTGAGAYSFVPISMLLQAANNLSDVASASIARVNLGLGSAATQSSTAFAQTANNLSDLASASAARTNLGLGTMATQNASSVAVTGGTCTGLSALGIGTSGVSSILQFEVAANLTGGTTGQAVRVSPQIQSDVTTSGIMFNSAPSTAAAAFTLANLSHFVANQSALGSGSAVTTQQGFYATSSLTGATNNYGFRGGLTSGTGRWNIYCDGNAANYLSGPLQIGSTTNDGTGHLLQVNSGISMNPTTTTTAPSAGGAGALPATPKGYFTININGTAQQVAYY